jgi:hypothetical protein
VAAWYVALFIGIFLLSGLDHFCPGSYVVLKYVRSLIKRLDTQEISCPPTPQGVIEGSRALHTLAN